MEKSDLVEVEILVPTNKSDTSYFFSINFLLTKLSEKNNFRYYRKVEWYYNDLYIQTWWYINKKSNQHDKH